MKFIWKIVAIIVCVALVDSTPLDDDPFAHEKCCPWTSKCRCPIERPPVFENPWICINGTMRHSNSATNSSVNYDIYYDAEAYNDTFYFENYDFVPAITMRCQNIHQTMSIYVLVFSGSIFLFIVCCSFVCKCKASTEGHEVAYYADTEYVSIYV